MGLMPQEGGQGGRVDGRGACHGGKNIPEPRLVGRKVLEMQIINLKNWDRNQGCQAELLSAASAARLAQYFEIKLDLHYISLNI